MKKILSILTAMIIALTFTSCGDESSFKKGIVDITIACVQSPSSNDFVSYVTLESGDLIVNDEVGTNVTTYHNVNGEKKVCLNSGKAHIIRGN